MKREYELAWFYFGGLGATHRLETAENERVVAVLDDVSYEDAPTDEARALLCLVERLVEE